MWVKSVVLESRYALEFRFKMTKWLFDVARIKATKNTFTYLI